MRWIREFLKESKQRGLGKAAKREKHRRRSQCRALVPLEGLEPRYLLSAAPIISEFVASNSSTLVDGFGESSDWIELFNSGDAAIDLNGWHLTDARSNPSKWTFPTTVLQPGDYLVVFASGADMPDPSGHLHTNFRLSSSGEYLALVSPEGVAVSQYFADGEYPKQRSDVSYGVGQLSTDTVLFAGTVEADVLVPTDNSLGTDWVGSEFTPGAGWQTTRLPIGFDVAGDGNGMDGEVVLQIDFDDRSVSATQDGFDAFTINGQGVQTTTVTRSFGDIDVTLSDASGAGYDDKKNFLPVNSGEFTQARTHQDFVYSLDDVGTGGLDVTISGLTPGQAYTTNLWSFNYSTSGERVSDWTINGHVAASNFTFTGGQIPQSDEAFKISALVAANSQGELHIEGRRDATSVSYGVYLNAIQVIHGEQDPDPPSGIDLPVTPILRLDMNDRLDGEAGAANTEPGYESFTLDANGAAYDGISVAMTAIGGGTLDDRDRPAPVDGGDFDLDQVYDDFVFVNGTSNGDGAEILIQGLEANTEYQVKIRSFDVSSTGSRRSIWSEASGAEPIVFADPYSFDGVDVPSDNDDNTITALLTTSSMGELLLRGERQGGTSHGVFINGLELGLPGLNSLIATDLQASMYEQATSAYARIPFDVPVDRQIDKLTLDIAHDAGFVAYLNGTEVARRNVAAGAAPDFDAVATTEQNDIQTISPVAIDLTNHAGRLVDGANLFAIHAINSSVADGDFFLSPSLTLATFEVGSTLYFDDPTPGAPNQSGFAGFVDDTKFSRGRGFYDAPFSLEITTASPDAEIYYTTDGSVPSPTNGIRYRAPVTISTTTILRAIATKDGYKPSNVDSQTYLFLEDVLTQDPRNDADGPEYPNTWQAGVTGDYEVDREVVAEWDDNSPANDDFGIREALRSIPTMSIVMDHDDLWGSNGIYPDATRRIRRPGSIEYFDPNTGNQFQHNVGVQMHGNASRDNVRLLKHSFRLIFSPEFDGPGRLNYPIFDGSDFEDINTLILRASFTDAFATRTATNRYSPMDSTYTRDVWMRETQTAMGSLSADNTYVHLYINGLYWGMYNPAEKADAAFYAAHEGGEPEDWDVIKDFDELDSGSKTAWNEMFTLANQLRDSPTPDDIYWELQGMNPDGTDNPDLPNYLDMVNLIDFMLVHYTTGPEDWPHHNWHAGRNRLDPGKGFQFQVWDQEIVLDGRFRDTTEAADKGPAQLHNRLRNSPEYLRQFGDRVQRHMFHGGALTVEQNQTRWTAIADHVEAAIIGESARWGDAREGQRITVSSGEPQVTVPTLTVNHWRDTIADVNDRQFSIYHESSLDWLREDGLFPGVNTPQFNQFGGEVPSGFQVTMNSPPSIVQQETMLHEEGDNFAVFVPADDALETGPGPHWYDIEFVPSGWTTGPSGVGYEDRASSLDRIIQTDIQGPWDANESSVYTRIEFSLEDGFDSDDVEELSMRLKYDDGFVVYLNGQRIESDRAPTPSSWDANATGSRISILSTIGIRFDLTEHASLLRPGENVLAIQGLNVSDTDGDMLIAPEVLLVQNVALDRPPIYFTTNGEDPRLLGGDLNPSAQLFTSSLTVDETTRIRARAFANDSWSAVAEPTFIVSPTGGGVVISEINFNPYEPTDTESAAVPGVENDDFEFIELLNTNPSTSVSLFGMRFTDGVEVELGDQTLAPGERVVLVRNPTAFATRYGADIRIVGVYSGKLSNGGERLEFVDASGDLVTSLDYGRELWPARADGPGATIELIAPEQVTVPLSGKYYSYRGSTNLGGSPGTVGPGPLGVKINEVLANSQADGLSDAIELRNTTSDSIDIGGWWLSDSRDTLQKYQIPAETVLAAGQRIVFDESDFNPTPATPSPNDFALDADGDDVWLVVAEQGRVKQFVDEIQFGGSSIGVTFGRTPSDALVPQSYATLGCENLHPRLGAVVISELNYNPGEPSAEAISVYQAISEDDLEFVELFNDTTESISLLGWRLRGGVDYEFDEGTLAPGATLLAISFDPLDPDNQDRVDAFRVHYGLSETVALAGGWSGQLSDSGEAVRLRRPDGGLSVVEDGLVYDDRSAWPTSADGGGNSLQRLAPVYAGNAAASWNASSPTPGRYAIGPNLVGDFTGDQSVDADDIDVLSDAVDRGIAAYLDLDGNGVVDDQDVNYLVTQVLATIPGDANLDGVVDGSDFNAWNANRFDECGKSWSHGDFNGDQMVDGADFNIWNARRFTGPAAASRPTRTPRAAVGTEMTSGRGASSRRIEALEDRRGRPDDTSMVHRQIVDQLISDW